MPALRPLVQQTERATFPATSLRNESLVSLTDFEGFQYCWNNQLVLNLQYTQHYLISIIKLSTSLVLYSARNKTRIFSMKFHWTQPCLINTTLVLYSARTKTIILSIKLYWTQPCLISTTLVLYSARTKTCFFSIKFHWTQPCLISTSLVLYSARTKTCIFSIKLYWTEPWLISTTLVFYSARNKTCIFFNEIALNSALCYKYQARTIFFEWNCTWYFIRRLQCCFRCRWRCVTHFGHGTSRQTRSF